MLIDTYNFPYLEVMRGFSLKIHLFLYVHTFHMRNIGNVSQDLFRIGFSNMFLLHVSIVFGISWYSRSILMNNSSPLSQSWMVNLHKPSRWSMVSFSFEQRVHMEGQVKPIRRRISQINIFLLATSHKKVEILVKMVVFQTFPQIGHH